MRLLILTQYFWPEEFRINDVALGLKEMGHGVTVLTGQPNYPTGKFFTGYGFFKKPCEDYQGMKIIRVPLFPRGRGGAVRLALNYFSFVLFACLVAPFRCRGAYDAIFVFEPSPVTVGLPALLLKKIKGAPILFWVQDLWPESLSATGAIRSRSILKWVERCVRYIYKGCDAILVQSRAFDPSIEKFDIPREKIHYFPNSAESFYQPLTLEKDASERANIPEGFSVMFAGNIGVSQDFGTILGAAEKLKSYSDIHWIILGDGRMLPWVKDQIAKRGLGATVHLLGRHPAQLMPRYFSLADVMLVSLKKDPIFSLTIPAKVQSYLACGKPIIASLEGEGARVVLESGAGLVAKIENSDEIAAAVLQMYQKSESERLQMGLKGRKYFEEHFERNKLLEQLVEWIHQLTKVSYSVSRESI